jgi:hypothetical protein
MKKITMFVLPVLLGAGALCSDAAEPQQTDRLRLGDAEISDVAKCIRESGQPNDFAETRYVDHTPMPLLRSEEQQRGYVVFGRHWMDLIFPNSIPKRGEITDKLATFATRGEFEPVTFCVRTVRELRGLEVKTAELVSPSGGRLAAPEVQLVRFAPRCWQGEEWLYEDESVGVMNMPTYLEKARLLDVAADRTVQYWLTVKVDEDANPGTYQGEIRISHEQGKTDSIEIMVKVLPVRLREPPHTLGFWDFQRPYQGEIGTLDQFYQVMSAHGMNAVFARVGLFEYDKKTDTYDFGRYLSIDDSGHVTVTLDGSPLETSMEAAKQAGLKSVIYTPTLSLFVTKEVLARYDKENLDQQISAEIAQVTARLEGSQQYEMIEKEITNASRTYYPMYSQAYADLYVEIVRGILKEAKRRNWPTLVLSTLDEAYSHHVHGRTAYPFVVRHLELDQRAGAITILNHCSPFLGGEYSAYVRAAMKHLDIAMPGGRLSLEPSRTSPYNATLGQLVAAFGKEGIATYNYSLSGQAGGVFPDLNVVRFSAGFFFHTLGEGVRGNIDYIFFRPEGDPYNPVDDYNVADNNRLWSHERLWFFPPREHAGRLGGRSLSLAAKREGFDDLRYLQTLEALIKEAQAKTDSPDAQQAARTAAATRKSLLDSFHFTDKALDNNRRNSWSRWDTVDVTKRRKPVVAGHLRLANGWTYATYDRSRWAIAQEIVRLQEAIGRTGTE